MPCTLLWLRLDLRLADSPALDAALKRGGPIIPVFIWAPEEEHPWQLGGASKWWLHQSLETLSRDLVKRGSRLILRSGATAATLGQLIKETGADAVFWNRRYEPQIRARDSQIKQALRSRGINAESFNAALLFEPWRIKNSSGKPFQVFTPFWKNCLRAATSHKSELAHPCPPIGSAKAIDEALTIPTPTKAPQRILNPASWPKSLPLAKLRLQPKPDWAGGLRTTWTPGEKGACRQLNCFLKSRFDAYNDCRNLPAMLGTSRLSPHLHFGEISPRQIWHAIRNSTPIHFTWQNSQFTTELGWREFSHHLLYHFPHTDIKPLRPEFAHFHWQQNPEWLRAWQKGLTGYPIVDAGMRELWSTGWMHNRVRMIVASFLVKDLRINWLEGARWFWDTLVDADLAQNTLGWQWTAGCGADAAPFFRIFNPASQGEKFDADGEYVRKWIPELSRLSNDWIHRPHQAPPDALAAAQINLGKTYPLPIVSHAVAREVALEEYRRIKKP